MDSTPDSATHQDAIAAGAPQRRNWVKLYAVENSGPPGSDTLSECAAYASATCRCRPTRVPAERSSLRCILANIAIEDSAASIANETQPQCGVRSWCSAPASEFHPKASSVPSIATISATVTSLARLGIALTASTAFHRVLKQA